MNSKEKYLEVFRTAIELREVTILLREKSRNLYVWSFCAAVVPIVVYFALLFFLSNNDDYKPEMKQVISLLSFFVLFLFFFYFQNRKFFRAGNIFKDVVKRCGELSDMVDWMTMRKRQVYSEVDERIQKPIDEFYEYSMSPQCPFGGGKKKFKMLRYMAIVEMIIVMVISFLMSLGVISI